MRHQPQAARTTARNATAQNALDAVPPRAAPPPRSLLGDRSAFLFEFLRHPTQIASVVPSSSFLEARLVRETDAARVRTIVELGPGTGGTTRALLQAMRPDARLLAIDLSPAFCKRLAGRVRDTRLAVQHGSAEFVATYLQSWQLPLADAIVSGIPFSTMPPDVADRIARAIAGALAPGGRFVAYQFSADVDKYSTPYLGQPKRRIEWLNVPPLRVFTWTKPK